MHAASLVEANQFIWGHWFLREIWKKRDFELQPQYLLYYYKSLNVSDCTIVLLCI